MTLTFQMKVSFFESRLIMFLPFLAYTNLKLKPFLVEKGCFQKGTDSCIRKHSKQYI